jgi:hypothetical protein
MELGAFTREATRKFGPCHRRRSTCFNDTSWKQVLLTSEFLKLDDTLALTWRMRPRSN